MADNVKPLFPGMQPPPVDKDDDSGIPGLPWSAIMGLVMHKLGARDVVIDRADVERALGALGERQTVIVHDTGELLIVRLMDAAAAKAYASMALVTPPEGQSS